MQAKDRGRRSLRVADYVNSCTPSASLVNLADKRSTRLIATPSSTSDGGALDQFQLNYQVSELQNKYEHCAWLFYNPASPIVSRIRHDIALERVRMLEDKISEVTQEKCKDAELYRNIIAKSKYLLVDMLDRKRQPASNIKEDQIACSTAAEVMHNL